MRDRGAVLYVTTTVLCSIALACILLRLLGAPKSQKKWVQVADDSYMVLNAVGNLDSFLKMFFLIRPQILLIGMMVCTILSP